MRWLLAAAYIAAGVGHFLATDSLLKMMPDWVPFPRQAILLSGAFEIVAACALLMKPLRSGAGIALAVYALCVWPANIKHAVEGLDISPLPSSWWYHGPRLAFQPVFIWWALFCADVIDWPWRRQTAQHEN